MGDFNSFTEMFDHYWEKSYKQIMENEFNHWLTENKLNIDSNGYTMNNLKSFNAYFTNKYSQDEISKMIEDNLINVV